MIAPDDRLSAGVLARLLRGDPQLDPDDLDWSRLLEAAEREHALPALEQWFTWHDEVPPPPVAAAFARIHAGGKSP